MPSTRIFLIAFVAVAHAVDERHDFLLERAAFMRGDKLVAIISEAASAGISLQADRRFANSRYPRDCDEHGVRLEWTPSLTEAVVRSGYSPKFGARPLRRAVHC